MSTPDPIAGGRGAADNERARAEAATLAREAELAGTTGTAPARLWISVADVRATRLGDAEGALKALESARLADPSSPAVLAALRRLAVRLWRWPLAADVLAAERKLLSGAERIARTQQLAEILADRLGRADEALVLFAEVLEGDPGNARALARAVPMWTSASAWTDMALAMEAAAESVRAVDAKRAAALFYEVGEVHRWRMHAPERAAEAFEKALQADEGATAAVKALAEVASELRDWKRLAFALEREADFGIRGEHAAAALTKLGSLREDSLDDPDGAEAAWRAALEKDPAHRPALAALARVAERRGDHALLAELREKELLQATDVRLAVALSLTLGQIYEERLGALDRAATQFQRVLAVTQTEAPAFRALGRLMAATGQWDLLIKLYEREAAETTDPVHKIHCVFKIAEIYEENLGDDRKAQENYGRVLEETPTYVPALRALGRIFQRREDWGSLVNLYVREAEAIEDPSHWLDVLGRVAVLQEEKLGALDAAARTWESVLTRLPEYLPALRALARLHYRRGDWAALVAINLREASLTKDPQVVAGLLHKTGEIYEDRLAVAEDAIRCYRNALDHVPNFLPAMRSLGRLAARRGAWKEVVETELLEAENVADPKRAASLLNSAAEHYEFRLGDVDSAIRTYERVLDAVPGYLPATAGLARLYRKTERWPELIRVLESSVPSLIRDPGGAAVVETEIAAIEGHRLGNDAAAQARIIAARHVLPEDPHVRRELEEYLAKAGGWNELAQLYAEAAVAAPPGAMRAGLYVRLGDLAWRASGGTDATKAANAFRNALIAEPGNRAAAGGLEDIALTTKDAKLRIEALTASSLAARSREERRAILVELARLHEDAGESQAAESCWSAAAQIAPDVDAWEALARGARRAERHVAAADALSRAVSESADPAEKERLTLEAAGDLVEGKELEQAEAMLLGVIATSPEPSAGLLALERVYRAMAARTEPAEPAVLGKLSDALRKLSAATRDPARKTELSVEAAKTLSGGLGREAEAAQLLEQVVESEPAGTAAQRDALTKLAEIYGSTGDRVRQAGVLERLAEGATGIARAEYLTAAGKVLAPMDIDRAITCWERAVAADPAATAALDALIESYRAREAWQPLLTTWNRVIQATRDPKVAAQGYFEKGVLLLERMRLPDKAEQHFQRSLSAVPTFAPALTRLAALYRDQKNIGAEREVLRRLVALEAAPDMRAARLGAFARACDELGDKPAALAALQEASALAPNDGEIWDRILAVQGGSATPEARVRALEKAIEATQEDAKRVALRVQLAQALGETGDDDGALAQVGAAVKAAPGDVEARATVARILSRRKGGILEAIDAHHAVLRIDPLRAESLAFLARAYEEAKQHDRVLLLGALVSLANSGNDAAIFYKEQIPRAPREAKAPLSLEDKLQLLAAPAARGKTGELLARLDGAAFRGGPADIAALGPTEPIHEGHPLFIALQGAKILLGLPEATAVLAKTLAEPARVLPGDPPVLALGPSLVGASDGVRRFLIARALFRMSIGWYPAARLANDVRNDFWLAAGALEVSEPPRGTDPKVLRAIVKAIPRKARKEIIDLLQAFIAKPDSFDIDAFLTGADRSADRAGLLACVDLADAAEGLALVLPEAGAVRSPTDTRAQILMRAAAGRDLLVFAAGDDLISLRKRAGLSILS